MEKANISFTLQFVIFAKASQYSFISNIPYLPVPAFAFPELIIRYFGDFFFKFLLLKSIVLDLALFFVNTALTTVFTGSSRMERSNLFLLYIPEQIDANFIPFTG